ncbi:MAG: carbon storage regulator [Armatimonadota bacterium]
MNRKIGETVVLGDQVEVTLVQVQLSQNQVRLGISAPRSVGVYRKEILQAIKHENILAASTSSAAQLPNLRQPSEK